MNTARKQRLFIVLFFVFGVGLAVGLALLALQENMNHYYSPLEMDNGTAPKGVRVRGGGLVVPGSLQRNKQSLAVRFAVTDGGATIIMEYEGILPDLFREGQGIVAAGVLQDDGLFIADEVLAKHDENYMPPEVQEAIDQAHPGMSQAASGAGA